MHRISASDVGPRLKIPAGDESVMVERKKAPLILKRRFLVVLILAMDIISVTEG